MDFATLVGLIAGIGLILWAIVTNESIATFVDIPSLAIVIGGAISATLISLPMQKAKIAMGVAKKAFLTKSASPVELINTLVGFAEIARRDGILALEEASKDVDDEFLVKGLQLAVDGADPELISEIMNTELQNLLERHRTGKTIFSTLGKYAPAFGMIGTLVGLVILLKNMDKPEMIGPSMAIALITTLYGAIFSNLVFLPIADKLDIRSKEERFVKNIIIQGVMAIQSGDNPRIVEQKLKIYLAPKIRTGVGKEE